MELPAVDYVDMTRPPPGWAVATRLCELAILLDDNIKAVTLLPADPAATRFFCDNLDLATRAPSWTNAERAVTTVGSYYRERGRIEYVADKARPLERVDDPLWHAASREHVAIGAALADLYLPRDHYIASQLSCWTGFHVTAKLHYDNRANAPLSLVHTLCERPTIVEIGDRLYQGPRYTHTLFKANCTRHCADMSQSHVMPRRPRLQAGHDVIKIVPRLTD